ncbi:MAG: phosphoribosylanthranilate isomerase [Anaerolineaceae bacterium]
MTLVKICGLRDPETALEAAKAGADFIGIMFAESKRKVTPQQCHDIIEVLKEKRTQGRDASFDGPRRGDVSAASWFGAWADEIEQAATRWRPLIVGVFADMKVDGVNNIADAAGLDLVQLSGGESSEFASRVHLPVIRAIHVAPGTTEFDVWDAATPAASAGILLDTASSGAYGGTGEAFDWEVAKEVARRTPFFLAGGLTPENVAEAVRQVEPWAVDVSTGVETNGSKDIEKIRAFIRAAKGVRIER